MDNSEGNIIPELRIEMAGGDLMQGMVLLSVQFPESEAPKFRIELLLLQCSGFKAFLKEREKKSSSILREIDTTLLNFKSV